MKHPVNAQAVNRDMVFLLTYFFVAAWHSADQSVKNSVQNELVSDIHNAQKDSTEESFLIRLQEVFQALDDEDRMTLKFLIDVINKILYAFEFSPFYAPFVLDRFILICLLSLDRIKNKEGESVKFLIRLVIFASYRLSIAEVKNV